jgi:arylsulfatase A-like enzyme
MPLSTMPDPADSTGAGHTVLDNTTIVTCSEIADGFFHNSQMMKETINVDTNGTQKTFNMSLPYVVIGGGSGYLRQGGQIVGATTMHTDLLATLADAMGVPIPMMGSQKVTPIADLKVAS